MKLITLLPYLFVFLASFYHSSDLDLGWHLKYGQYFIEHGQILKENIFSSEMQGYRYPNTSWGSDILLYIIFSKFGFLGISALGAVVVTLTFYFFAKAAKLTLWDQAFIFPLIAYLQAPVNSAAYRAQLTSLLFAGILVYLLAKLHIARKIAANQKLDGVPPNTATNYQQVDAGRRPERGGPFQNRTSTDLAERFLMAVRLRVRIATIILLFLIWVNFHGEYLTGIILLFGWTIIYLAKRFFEKSQRKFLAMEIITLTLLVLIASAVTLINPFGDQIYKESLRHFGNPLQQYVVSWLPLQKNTQLWWNHLAMGIAMIGAIFLAIRKKSPASYLPFLLITAALYFLPFWSRRYAWIFYYLAFFPLAIITKSFIPKNKKVAVFVATFFLSISFMALLPTKRPLSQFANMSWQSYCEYYIGCSQKSAEFLETLCQDKKCVLYTFYDWGGWLIYNYPQVKPSMDGRMALWRDQDGQSSFEKYYALEQNWQDIDKSKYNAVLISPRKPLYHRLTELSKQGKWDFAYQDQYAGVFVRKLKVQN